MLLDLELIYFSLQMRRETSKFVAAFVSGSALALSLQVFQSFASGVKVELALFTFVVSVIFMAILICSNKGFLGAFVSPHAWHPQILWESLMCFRLYSSFRSVVLMPEFLKQSSHIRSLCKSEKHSKFSKSLLLNPAKSIGLTLSLPCKFTFWCFFTSTNELWVIHLECIASHNAFSLKSLIRAALFELSAFCNVDSIWETCTIWASSFLHGEWSLFYFSHSPLLLWATSENLAYP
jgi:hypothetical protein